MCAPLPVRRRLAILRGVHIPAQVPQSRSVSNLGSSFGTAIAGTILVSDLASGNTSYVVAMSVLAGLALLGLAAAVMLPERAAPESALTDQPIPAT